MHNRCPHSIQVVLVNEYFRVSNVECTLVNLNGWPLFADRAFCVTKKLAGGILYIFGTSSRSALSRLVSSVVMFKALDLFGLSIWLKTGIIDVRGRLT